MKKQNFVLVCAGFGDKQKIVSMKPAELKLSDGKKVKVDLVLCDKLGDIFDADSKMEKIYRTIMEGKFK